MPIEVYKQIVLSENEIQSKKWNTKSMKEDLTKTTSNIDLPLDWYVILNNYYLCTAVVNASMELP